MSPKDALKTAAIVLAAGASTRLGEPKQLATLGRETLLGRAVRVAREAGCSPVLVVLGAGYESILAEIARGTLGEVVPVINDRWKEGMASSIFFGVRALGFVAKQARGVILMTCDQPAVTAKHLRALADLGEVTASEYAGQRGVPAYFPASWFAALSKLKGDGGARELLREARTVALEGGELDLDTPDALKEARRRFE
jgi:CTP:molybdopterin cytidylyltransferase MocA